MYAGCLSRPVPSNMDGWMEDTFIGSNSSTTQHEKKLYSQGELPRTEECFHHLIIYKHTWWKLYGVFSRLIWFFYSPLSPRNLCKFLLFPSAWEEWKRLTFTSDDEFPLNMCKSNWVSNNRSRHLRRSFAQEKGICIFNGNKIAQIDLHK